MKLSRSIRDLPRCPSYNPQNRPTYVVSALILFTIVVVMYQTHTSNAVSSLMGGANRARYIFVFGDSYTDTRFNPYEEQPSMDKPFGNPEPEEGYWLSGGPNFLQKIVFDLSPENTLCWNYAKQWGVVNNDFNRPKGRPKKIPSMQTQVSTQFRAALVNSASKPDWNADNSIALVWFGTNDVVWYDRKKYNLGNIFDSYIRQMEVLYTFGLRKFVVPDIPPFPHAPNFDINHPDDGNTMRAGIKSWNERIEHRLHDFKDKHPDISYKIIKTHRVFNDILFAHGPKLSNQRKQCHSLDGKTCWWTKNIHVGQEIHDALAKTVWEAMKEMGFYD